MNKYAKCPKCGAFGDDRFYLQLPVGGLSPLMNSKANKLWNYQVPQVVCIVCLDKRDAY